MRVDVSVDISGAGENLDFNSVSKTFSLPFEGGGKAIVDTLIKEAIGKSIEDIEDLDAAEFSLEIADLDIIAESSEEMSIMKYFPSVFNPKQYLTSYTSYELPSIVLDDLEELNESALDLENISNDIHELAKLAYYAEQNGEFILDVLDYLPEDLYGIEFYPGMTIEDVARDLVEEGVISTEILMNYIDYDALARDLEVGDGYNEVPEVGTFRSV